MAEKNAFQKIASGAQKAGVDSLSAKRAREWFRAAAEKTARVNRQSILRDGTKTQSALTNRDVGTMFMFYYDAKHKATLPYWDRFPLIFVMEDYGESFLGINLHYLPLYYRAKLMDALYTLAYDDSKTGQQKLSLSYQILKGASKFKFFSPCVKKYLKGHVVSSFYRVASSDWDAALFLPTARWVGASEATVWTDSLARIYKL